MKKLINATLILGIFFIGFLVGFMVDNAEVIELKAQIENQKEIEVTEVYYQDGDVQEYEGFYLEDGDTLVMLSDDSFGIANLQKNTFSFQPVEMGDWDYELDNQKQFENIIKTYLSMKNNGYY